MLWCWNSSRHRIHNCSHLFEHGTSRSPNRSQTPRCHGYDDVKANVVQVSRNKKQRLALSHTDPPRYQGHIGAALVLGGVDATGPHLFTIHPHGSTDKLPYVTMGSGSLAAMAVFETGWRANMEVRA